MSCATTAFTKSLFVAPWRVGDAAVGIRNAAWTTAKSAYPCCEEWQEISAESSLMPTPNDPVGRGTELNMIINTLGILLCHGRCIQQSYTSYSLSR